MIFDATVQKTNITYMSTIFISDSRWINGAFSSHRSRHYAFFTEKIKLKKLKDTSQNYT